MKHLGNNATEANRQRNISATMQRKQISKETSRQQCSGGKSAKKHLGNNAAEANQQRNTSATMQRRQIGEETSWQQCSGDKSAKKHLGIIKASFVSPLGLHYLCYSKINKSNINHIQSCPPLFTTRSFSVRFTVGG